MSKSVCSTGLRWLWVVVAVLIIDLGSKFLILQNFALGDTVSLFPSLNLHYARNYGAAFSFLADSGGWQRWFFAGIAIGISVILAVMMYRSKATQKLNNIAVPDAVMEGMFSWKRRVPGTEPENPCTGRKIQRQ